MYLPATMTVIRQSHHVSHSPSRPHTKDHRPKDEDGDELAPPLTITGVIANPRLGRWVEQWVEWLKLRECSYTTIANYVNSCVTLVAYTLSDAFEGRLEDTTSVYTELVNMRRQAHAIARQVRSALAHLLTTVDAVSFGRTSRSHTRRAPSHAPRHPPITPRITCTSREILRCVIRGDQSVGTGQARHHTQTISSAAHSPLDDIIPPLIVLTFVQTHRSGSRGRTCRLRGCPRRRPTMSLRVHRSDSWHSVSSWSLRRTRSYHQIVSV